MDEWWIGKDLEGNDHDLSEVLSCHLPGGTDKEKMKNLVELLKWTTDGCVWYPVIILFHSVESFNFYF
jgi:hypothetical protein